MYYGAGKNHYCRNPTVTIHCIQISVWNLPAKTSANHESEVHTWMYSFTYW